MKNRYPTQTEEILGHLQENGSINPMQALNLYGCMRLASRICDLKRAGYKITKTMHTRRNRRGRVVNFAEYELHELEANND